MAAMSGQGGVIPMITLEECAMFAALETNELFTGAVLSPRHQSLLSSYLLNLKRGPSAVRKMIVRHSCGDVRRNIGDLPVPDVIPPRREFRSDASLEHPRVYDMQCRAEWESTQPLIR
jgi:hypothetical protein